MTYDSIPTEWSQTDFTRFSKEINLFDYQREALESAAKLLYYYFDSLLKFDPSEGNAQTGERKKRFFHELKRYEKDLVGRLGISNYHNGLLFDKLKQYYPVTTEESVERIPFQQFVNRMSSWMATGSGKTIILVKLIELLDRLKSRNLIPNNDILIMTHRDDLIDQILELIQAYNQSSTRKIRTWVLTRFEEVKRGGILPFKDDINVFIYRSDLIAEQTKEKQIGFEDIENSGRWYLLLDEAHKGDKEDSKRQLYYSLLSRNGFLFNFSATFTDPWDILTGVYNFNLDSFIRQGYGKNVYLSQQELSVFKDKTDFSSKGKERVIPRALVLFTLVTKSKTDIDRRTGSSSYHKPLLVSLVNSVNTQDADLEIFFKTLESIGSEEIDAALFRETKAELSAELLENPGYEFGGEGLRVSKERIASITIKDLRKAVFHTERRGSIEVKKIPENDNDPNNLFTLHVVCKTCQDSTLPKTMCDRNCTVCPFVSRPCNTTSYTPRIELAATMDANQPCPNCRQNTKRLALATSNVMAPVSVTAFDDDLPTILDQATFKAKMEMGAKGVSFDHIEKILALKEIALTRVKSITCTYAFRVGEAKPVNFPDGNAYVIVDNGSAAVFQFDAARLPVGQDEKLRILHAAAHALIQPAGYVTGLGSESYREYIDPGSNSIMIYSTEPGGCDVLVREPAKLYTWLKRSRAVVHGCKNDCDDGCKSCLYIPNWQCQRFNHDIDRRGLVNL
jgi:hypothetical protein